MKTYNLYCDESCHLENDKLPVMCIGYTKIDRNNYADIKEDIKAIKLKHKNPTEIKWQKLSLSRIELYKELIDYFFDNPIEFRCVLIKNKEKLNHLEFNQGSHDNFYYKTVYLLLNSMTNPVEFNYRVMLDVKDTRGKEKLEKIQEVFHNKYNGASPFTYFQNIHSCESEFLQLTDLFIGAITYKSRGAHLLENASKVKVEIANYLEQKSGYSLDDGTEPWEQKFNIFDFQIKSK